MKFDKNKYILLFENCQLTKGYGRTLLVDFQRDQMEFLDNEIYDIFISKSRKHPIGEILDEYDDNKRAIILEYIDFLLANEYAFFVDKDEIDFFPILNLTWENPAIITNCLIDFDSPPITLKPYINLISDLDSLGCENVQIRDYFGLPIEFLKSFLSFFNNTIIYRIELILKFNGNLEDYKELLHEFPRVNELIIHSAQIESNLPTDTTQRASVTKQIIIDSNCCGVISPKYLNLELHHFLESKSYNSCLNRKISVDSDGNIKNCPSLKTSYGSIFTTNIKEVLAQKEFSKVWNLRKDDIDDCKVCEFRHACTDCRAYLEADISYKKPAKCNYNPYVMTWEE